MKPEAPSWQKWTLDAAFFDALAKWDKEHGESKIDRVLLKVCNAIDAGDDYLKFIPDNPFPARGIVDALGQLIKLFAGLKIAQLQAYNFAQDISKWIVRETTVFASAGETNMIDPQAWANLEEIRKLIEEICLWAQKMLKISNSWLKNLGQRLTVDSTIQTFKGRLDEASKRFMLLSVISISSSQGKILQNFGDYQQDIRRLQQDIDLIQDFINRAEHAFLIDNIKSTLSLYVADSYTYAAQSKELCLDGTRIQTLSDIKKWAFDLSEDVPRLFHLTGQPGSGKSTIATTVCSLIQDYHVFCGQYFISRLYSSTLVAKKMFLTISLQLALHFPAVAQELYQTLQARPSIRDGSIKSHLDHILMPLLNIAAGIDPEKPVFISLDALDELDGYENTSSILGLLSTTLQNAPKNVKCFLSTRGTDTTTLANHFIQVDLDETTEESIRDVELLISVKLDELSEFLDKKERRKRVPLLCKRASGLFLWAAVATKFLLDHVPVRGRLGIQKVFDDLLPNAKTNIDSLYDNIIDSLLSDLAVRDDALCDEIRWIIGTIVVLSEPFSIDELTTLLNAKGGQIEHHIGRFRTILVAGNETITGSTIPRVNVSFYQYITRSPQESRLRVDAFASCKEIASRAFLRFKDMHVTDYDDPNVKFLHTAISCYENSKDDDRLQGAEKFLHLNSLAVALEARYDVLEDEEDLNRAIYFYKVISDESKDPKFKSFNLDAMCYALLKRLKGTMRQPFEPFDDLIATVPPKHKEKMNLLVAIAYAFFNRFDLYRDYKNLDVAISKYEDLSGRLKYRDPLRLEILCALGSAYVIRYRREKVQMIPHVSTVTQAIDMYEKALLITPRDANKKRMYLLFALSYPLAEVVEATEGAHSKGIKRSISLYREICRLIPQISDHVEFMRELRRRPYVLGFEHGFDPKLIPHLIHAMGETREIEILSPDDYSLRYIWRSAPHYVVTDILRSLEDNHPDKPDTLARLGEIYYEMADMRLAIIVYRYAILWVRKYGYYHSSYRRPWLYSETIEYNCDHPKELEKKYALRWLELTALRDGIPFDRKTVNDSWIFLTFEEDDDSEFEMLLSVRKFPPHPKWPLEPNNFYLVLPGFDRTAFMPESTFAMYKEFFLSHPAVSLSFVGVVCTITYVGIIPVVRRISSRFFHNFFRT